MDAHRFPKILSHSVLTSTCTMVIKGVCLDWSRNLNPKQIQFCVHSLIRVFNYLCTVSGSELVSLRNKDVRTVYITEQIFTAPYRKFFLFTIRGSYYAVEFVFFRSPWNIHFRLGARRTHASYNYVSYYARAE